MNIFLTGFVVTFFVCLVTVWLGPSTLLRSVRISRSQRGHLFSSDTVVEDESHRQRASHGLWIGLMISTLFLGFVQGWFVETAGERLFRFGPSLHALWIVSLPLLMTSLMSDFLRPRSERHLLGLLLSGIGLALVGYHIPFVSLPGGTTILVPLLGFALTVVWLILFAAIIEVASLIPFGVSGLVIVLCGVVFIAGGAGHSVASGLLVGIVFGSVVSRMTCYVTLRRLPAFGMERPVWGKAEVFILGLWTTAMVNVSFVKSVALAGVVIPVIALTTVLIIGMIRTFERSLILRDIPR